MSLYKVILERFADESFDGMVQLVVSKIANDSSVKEYLNDIRQDLNSTRIISAPHALLPPPLDRLPKRDDKQAIAKFNRFVKTKNSITGMTLGSMYNLANRSPEPIHSNNKSTLETLISTKLIKGLVGKATSDMPKATRPKSIPYLRITDAALLHINKDDIAALPTDILEGNYRVFGNQLIKPPTVHRIQKSQLPPSVLDFYSHTWGLETTGAMAAWGALNARGQGVKVAVLDTGIDPNHPSLAGRVHSYAEFDHNGQIVTQNIEDASDHDGHGTHCAGTIAGNNASGRWIGMAPEAQIIAGKVLGPDGGSPMQILAGMEWAMQAGADVISMSLGDFSLYPEVADTYTEQIVRAHQRGIPVIAAIGNDGHQTSGNPGSNLLSLSIGAVNHKDIVAGFSGGRTQILKESKLFRPSDLPIVYIKPDITAPGVAIYSSLPSNKYGALSGTSMATPHVAGAIAQLLSSTGGIKSNLTGPELVKVVQSLLIGSVNDLGEVGQDQRYGYGRLNALNAVSQAHKRGYWTP
jgi:subtilisin family serine protease